MGYGMDEMVDMCDEDECSITCKRCGVDELFWDETAGGWRLFDSDGMLHSCPAPGKGKK